MGLRNYEKPSLRTYILFWLSRNRLDVAHNRGCGVAVSNMGVLAVWQCGNCKRIVPMSQIVCSCMEAVLKTNTKFKVGDRVVTYGHKGRLTGKVTCLCHDGTFGVRLDKVIDGHDEMIAHPKQCRLLKKKYRQRIWLPTNWNDGRDFQPVTVLTNPDRAAADSIEFIEVKKK